MDVQSLIETFAIIQQASNDTLGFNVLLMLPVFFFTEVISRLGNFRSRFPKRYRSITALLSFTVSIPIAMTAFPLSPLTLFMSQALILASACSLAYIVIKPFFKASLNFIRRKFKERTGVEVEG